MWIITRVVSFKKNFNFLYSKNNKQFQFGESRWTRAIFCAIVFQAVLAIVFESIIFAFHFNEITAIDNLKSINTTDSSDISATYANARSLLVYFVLFMLAQIFTVLLVVDAVRNHAYTIRSHHSHPY